ncbi:E3 SUMO-protein ligase ZBED1-like [Macrosteles quadrilineatus]|uniref:E3 SUMO-protein ligase ZBED1-like n=1 Tax=Macrosteles quadrilineatus TaxID=74068 RepID=UPI0023E1FE56|nr:E3 SUMO-protein ligase ZBED1-like [Macrosteles quadrilineatus]
MDGGSIPEDDGNIAENLDDYYSINIPEGLDDYDNITEDLDSYDNIHEDPDYCDHIENHEDSNKNKCKRKDADDRQNLNLQKKKQKVAPIFITQTKQSNSTSINKCSRSNENEILPSTSQIQSPSPPIQLIRNANPLWNYFEKPNKFEGKCKICQKMLKQGTSGTTSSLIKHLKSHKQSYESYTIEKQKYEEQSKKSLQIPTDKKIQQKLTIGLGIGIPKWPLDCKEQKKVDGLVSTFIVQGLHPYSIVEEPGFKRLINAGFPKYNHHSRTTFSRSIIPKLYNEEMTKVKSIINEDLPYLESLAFTTDGWKSRSGDSYFSLTCHYIDKDFNSKSFCLGNKLFEEKATGENISNFLKTEMYNWGLSERREKVIPIYMVTDGGKNIVNAVKQTTWVHRECFAHKLQLVVESAVNSDTAAQEMLQKSRSIVGHYHKSNAATSRFKKIQQQLSMNPKHVIQMVDTRWNSEFLMLERLVELKIAINTELATSHHSISILSQDEWGLAEAYIESLKPIEVITRIMSADKYPTSSMIIPVLHEIETKLTNIIASGPSNKSNSTRKSVSFAKNLLNSLKTRFPLYKDNSINQICTALDPRFKCVLLEKNLIVKKLEQLAETIYQSMNHSSVQQPDVSRETQPSCSKENDIWSAFNKAASKQMQPSLSPGIQEVNAYFQDGLVEKTVNPFVWWKQASSKYPILSKLAQNYLPIPATQASSERLFSAAGNIITQRRESLTPEHAEQLLFLFNVYKDKD